MGGLAILILAAGRSSRMQGTDKLLLDVDGVPLLRHIATEGVNTGLPVMVTVPATGAEARRAVLRDLPVTCVTVADPDAGMAASMASGIAALPTESTGVLLVLGDMPDLTTTDMRALADAFDGSTILRATDVDGVPGHPVVFPARLFDAIKRLSGDQGAQSLLRRENVKLVALPGKRATTDLDTPENWARWRNRKS